MKRSLTDNFRAAFVCMAAAFCSQAFAEDALLTPLHGTAGNSGESYDMLIDGSRSTKWCMSNFKPSYIVFKADHAFVPTSYTLITGLDTKKFPDRNWKTWSLYAANFDSDEEATRESDAWRLIDVRKQMTSAEFPAGNNQPTGFDCSENPTDEYRYFKIELQEIVSLESSSTMQMAEFTFSEPAPQVELTAIGGRDKLWGDGGYANLVDNDQQTKWGGDNQPVWVIVKAGEPIQPDFYRVLTANDTHSNPDRNWVDWTVSGANFDSDEEATLESDKWTVLDERTGVGRDRMPAARYTEAIFGFNRQITEPYQYYLINVTSTGGLKMQMAEFGFGYNKYELNSVRNSYYQRAAKFDYNVVAQKSLTEAYPMTLAAILEGGDVEAVIAAYGRCTVLGQDIESSRTAYEAYVAAADRLRMEYGDGHINAEGAPIVAAYLNDNAAPGGTYQNGTYPYIMENLLLDVDRLNAEIAYINNLIVEYSVVVEDPIDVAYTAIEGTPGSNSEEDVGAMFDGMESTKWCTKSAANVVVFSTSSPVRPTFYRLVTANDTKGNPGRNWKTWNIYAGDFASEEEATADAEGWVLIDQKTNVGTDQLPADNFKSAYFYLSSAPSKEYSYFKIEVKEIVSGNVMQMAEFSFGNQASFFAIRQEYYDTFADFDLETPAYRALTDEYRQMLETLRTTANLADLGTLYNRLTAQQGLIIGSQEVYANYEMKVAEAEAGIDGLDGPVADFLRHYINDEVEPGAEFANGSFPYIMANCQLTNAQVNTEIAYLDNLIISATNGAYLALEGTAGFNDREGFAALVDGDHNTKWGLNMKGTATCVFKVSDTEEPFFYTLVTGNDTKTDYGRNWKTWNIYGANFEKDSDAKADAEGWTLVDRREGIGQDRLPAENNVPAYFGFTEDAAPRYRYYKVEITEPYSGTQIQMGELTFGSEEDFMPIKDEYHAKVDEFDSDVIAEQALLDAYGQASADIYNAEGVDQLMDIYAALKAMQDTITLSAKAYAGYAEFTAGIENYLNDNPVAECEQADRLTEYIKDYVEPGDRFPNGSAQYIMDTHTLSAAQLAEETAFATGLQKEAVAGGYMAGTDITVLLENADFSDGWNGWDGVKGFATGQAPNGLHAAEATGRFDLSQTLTGLKDGVYEFVMNAGSRCSDTMNSNNLNAYVYANGNENYVMSVGEGQVPKDDAVDGVNCHLTGEHPDREVTDEWGEVTGYGIYGVHGVCYAIGVGRHENHIVANVTDGTLTVGIKCLGTGANWDWTGFGNARLRYLGTADEASEGIARTLADMSARAQTLVDYVGYSDEDKFTMYPNYCADTREALSDAISAASSAATGKESLDLVGNFTELFHSVYDEKAAYRSLLASVNKIQRKWEQQPLTDLEYDALSEDIYGKGWTAFEEGSLTAGQARANRESLLETYPDYLECDEAKASNGVTVEQTAPFTYVITVNGDNPFVGFSGFYDNLERERMILHFQYRASRDVTDGEMFFATPELNGSKNLLYGMLEQTDEWRDMYLDVESERLSYGFGNADHWIRWDMTNEADLTFELRNIHMITREQAIAQGGIITGVEQIEEAAGAARPASGIYTLTGVRVQKPLAPGLYIIDGRKVMIR